MNFNHKTILMIFAVMEVFFLLTLNISAKTGNDPAQDKTELSVNDNTQSKTPLSPKGNMTSIDDVHQVTDTSDKSTVEDKQFITVKTKNGNVFYIIIDRSGDTDNVYFLNTVDESDLMALTEEEKPVTEAVPECSCTERCKIGNINESCVVCQKNILKCIGEETVQDEKEPELIVEKKTSGSSRKGLLLLVVLGGGALFWFKLKKKKPSTKGATDPSDYEDDEEEETEEETEPNPYDDESEANDEDEESEEEE